MKTKAPRIRKPTQNPIIIEIDTALMGDKHIAMLTRAVINNDLETVCDYAHQTTLQELVEAVVHLRHNTTASGLKFLRKQFAK